MTQVPFLFVNITAFCCFFLLFVTFLAAKKTSEIYSFMILLGVLMVWSGASVLMRMQMFPGVPFWFYASILALFSIALCCYLFIHSFVREKGSFLKIVWIVLTVIILIFAATGVFLEPPVPELQANGTILFRYSMSWPIAIPLVLLLAIVVSTAQVIFRAIRTRGLRSPGLLCIIVGCVLMALGNMVSILPGNVFPWDQFTGIVCAILLTWALYKKHMFHMTLLISRTLLLVILAFIFALVTANFIGPLKSGVTQWFQISDEIATTAISVFFALVLMLIYTLLKRMLDELFSWERQQDKRLSVFSSNIAQSLNVSDIMQQLVQTICAEIPANRVFVCLPERENFAARCSNSSLDMGSFAVSKDSPCLEYLREQGTYLLMDEFRCSPLYQSVWEREKALFDRIDLGCMVALRDQMGLVGIVMLSQKERGGKYTYAELDFLSTISSITSIAIKNAALYEQVYREARIDSLTGVYNYRYFVEQIEEQFAACRGSSLALLYIDLDDFKLYNQLYGSAEGDRALVEVSNILRACVGESGTIFRSSGKVFAILMPHYDGRQAEALAQEVQRQVTEINVAPEKRHMKPISVSCGICVSPFAASSPKELMENADMAAFHAKNSGKQGINQFEGNAPRVENPESHARHVVYSSDDSSYQDNAATVNALTAAIDARDHYTFQHSQNVARYASILAAAFGLNDEQIRMIYEAGLLHDIGKISIGESVLGKNGKLTSEEYEIMKGHVNNSIDIIRHLSAMDYLIPAVVGHHERWDGRGYPRGISKEEIPLSARCLAVADAFDAMTTNRPYRNAMSLDYAIGQLEAGAGTEFDPKLATLFVQLVRSGDIKLAEAKV